MSMSDEMGRRPSNERFPDGEMLAELAELARVRRRLSPTRYTRSSTTFWGEESDWSEEFIQDLGQEAMDMDVDMDNDAKNRLTRLWVDAGMPACPMTWDEERLGHPDWSDPMTEFAFMCAAEQAYKRRFGGDLELRLMPNGNYSAHTDGIPIMGCLNLPRIEATLAVLKACREGE